MATTYLDSMAGPLGDWIPEDHIFGHTVKYGTTNKVDYTFKGIYETTGSRFGATFTNVLTNFGSFDMRAISDVQTYAGVNAEFVSDGYGLNAEKVTEALRRTGKFPPGTMNDIVMRITSTSFEAHTGVLINMLRFYMAMIADPDGSKSVENMGEVFYDDGHVAISYADYCGVDKVIDHSFKIGDVTQVNVSATAVPFAGNYYPAIHGFTKREFGILLAMVSEIKSDSMVRMKSSSPKLAEYLAVSIENSNLITTPVTDFTSEELFMTMAKYINANRVFEEFDKAYIVAATMVFGPMPRAVEAMAWVKPNNGFNIPKVSSHRGYISDMVEGVPFVTRADALSTWSYFKENQKRFWSHAIIACEMLFTGIFEIATASPGGLDQAMLSLGMPALSLSKPMRVLVEASSYRLGTPTDMPWLTSAGPNYMDNLLSSAPSANPICLTLVHDAEGYDVYQIDVNGKNVTRVRATDLKPALFPVLSMGINDNRYYLNSMRTEAVLNFDSVNKKYHSHDHAQVNKAMSIFRVAGYDAEASSATGLKTVRNWAANSNGQVMPVFMLDGGGSGYFTIKEKSIAKRGKHWIEMPNVYDKIQMTMQATLLDYVVFTNGKKVYQHGSRVAYSKPATVAVEGLEVTDFSVRTKPDQLSYQFKSFLFLPPTDETALRLPSVPLDTKSVQFTETFAPEDGQEAEVAEGMIEEV